MFESFKNFFKKKKDYIVFNIDFDKYTNNNKVLCYEDFYKVTGILETIEEIRKANNQGKYHYKNVQANSETYKKIEEVLKYNLIKTKNKFSKFYKETYLTKKFAWDCLMWSPYTNEKLQYGEIKILLPNNKEFVKVKEGE